MKLTSTWLLAVALILTLAPVAHASHGISDPDVKVISDNNNADGGSPNPSFDAQNRQSGGATVATSPVKPRIIAAGGNDYRMAPVTGDVWVSLYVSSDDGATWFNTMVPGFPSDTSAAGLASPLLGLAASGDPIVRFDAAGNLYAAGMAFNRDPDQPGLPVDAAIFVARYNYTPGTPAGVSTPNSAADPPNFTYAGTTIVNRAAAWFAVLEMLGLARAFVDKDWIKIDGNSPAASLCAGSVYVAYTGFYGVLGGSPIKFARSTDGGATFARSVGIPTGGKVGTPLNQGADIAIAPNGTIYIAYEAFRGGAQGESTIGIVRSTDCGKHWSQPVTLGSVVDSQAPGVAFRTLNFPFVAVDDRDPSTVYVAYQNFVGGDYNIYVQRSTDGGLAWSAPAKVNDDGGTRHQIFPAIDVSNGALHVAWYDFRNSTTDANEELDVYYACTECDGNSYPAFSHSVRVTDISSNGNCLTVGGGTSAYLADYIELDARWNGSQHEVHVAWADNRDVSECDLDPAPGPAADNTGNHNQNIYTDKLLVSP